MATPVKNCEKTSRLAEAAMLSIMDKNHNTFAVSEPMPGAQTVSKIKQSEAESFVAKWDRLPRSRRRTIWFAIDWDGDVQIYELLSNREEAVVHTGITLDQVGFELYRDDELSEERGFDIYTPNGGGSAKLSSLDNSKEDFPKQKVNRSLKRSGKAKLSNVPSEFKDEAMYYLNDGFSVNAEKRDNGNYDITISQ